jgi:hypothetical protein
MVKKQAGPRAVFDFEIQSQEMQLNLNQGKRYVFIFPLVYFKTIFQIQTYYVKGYIALPDCSCLIYTYLVMPKQEPAGVSFDRIGNPVYS